MIEPTGWGLGRQGGERPEAMMGPVVPTSSPRRRGRRAISTGNCRREFQLVKSPTPRGLGGGGLWGILKKKTEPGESPRGECPPLKT